MVWLYVPELEALNSDLNESSLISEPWLSWRGKPSQPQTWSKRWKRGGWIRRLSGLTYEPSTANLGAEKWILSLPDSHASLSASLESVKESKIAATFGPRFQGSLARLDPQSLSWRTSQVSLMPPGWVSLETCPKWGMILRGELFELQKPEHLTKERDSLGLESWPTPTGIHAERGNHNEPLENYLQRVEDYQTGKTKGKPGKSLGVAVRFPNPTTQDAGKATKKLRTNHQNNLTAIVFETETFPTPTARDWKGGYREESLTRKDGKSRGFDHLPNAAIGGVGTDQHPGQLNPDWVEWLMGWPIGWTACGPAGTESCPSKQN